MTTEDPNLISDNQNIGLSPLTINDVRTFFDTYIKPYAPYQEEKVYNTLINNLTEYYYNQAYFNIPSELKQIFEESNFDSLLIYNKMLVSIGVPDEIINTISMTDKIIFLKTLADFERYKGTISFFKKVTEAFSDRLSTYELFIDFDGVNWVFKPVKLYVHSDMELNISPIPYSTIRNAIPSLLLSEEQLTTLYSEEKLILPIKSNLLLLDNDLTSNVSLLYDVIVAIFLHAYKENYIDVYFKDNSMGVQLKTIYFLWYYLLTNYYEIPWTAFSAKVLLKFIYSDIGFPTFIGTTPTTIDSLSEIIDRYNSIGIVNTTNRDIDLSRKQIDEFVNDISKAFYSFSDSSATTVNDMYNSLVIMNSALISYVDNRITNSSIGKKAEINLILSEIYSSLALYASVYTGDSYFGQYADYFLRYLPQVVVNPENTTTYTIMYNLKPYHVELYSIYSSGVKCYDKFNQVYIDDESEMKFAYQLEKASVLNFSDDYLFGYKYVGKSELSVISTATFNTLSILPDDIYTITDNSVSSYMKEVVSLLNFTNEFSMKYNKDLISDVICRDAFNVTKVPE